MGSKSARCNKWEVKPATLENAPCSFPWPSDHRAVLSTVSVKPVDVIHLVAVARRRVVRFNEEVAVCVQLPNDWEVWGVALVTAGGSALEDCDVLVAFYFEPLTERRCNRFGTSSLPEGEYDAVLVSQGSLQELHRVRFAVISFDTRVQLSASMDNKTNSVLIRWEHSPGDRHDFIGVYIAGFKNIYAPLGTQYVGGLFSGNATLNVADTSVFAVPLSKGAYEVLFLSNDQYVELARCSFEIS